MKNVTNDNHYVPQHLLKNFADADGKLWIYDTQLNKYRYGNTKSAGFECKLYPPEVEKVLTKIVDTPGAEAIAELLKQKKLNGEQWVNFLGFVAAQMQRTPTCFDRFEAISTPTMQETAERIAKFHKGFRKDLEDYSKQSGATSEEIAELFHIVDTGQFKVTPNKEYVLEESLNMIPMIHEELARMRWMILGVPNGEPDLIIGDHAVMLSDEGFDDRPSAPLGLRNPNIELVIPLSRRMVAIARWTGPDSFGEIGRGSANVINERTLRYARRFIFASYQSDTLLADAVKFRGTGPKIHVRRVRIGEGLAIIPEYR